MALGRGVLTFVVALVSMSLVRADFHLDCPMLPPEECAFAVSFSGNRCVLEKILGSNVYICQTSDIKVGDEAPIEYIETDSCVNACGVERMTVGFSTDDIFSGSFTSKLCSIGCRENCGNLVDLYSNIIAGEGITLSELCGEQRRAMLIENKRLIGFGSAEAPAYFATPPAAL